MKNIDTNKKRKAKQSKFINTPELLHSSRKTTFYSCCVVHSFSLHSTFCFWWIQPALVAITILLVGIHNCLLENCQVSSLCHNGVVYDTTFMFEKHLSLLL